MDQNFEKCLGKYSDSYEHALDIFGQHLGSMKKNNLISHSQSLESQQTREKKYLMGDKDEPVYDEPKGDFNLDLKPMDFGIKASNTIPNSPAEQQEMPFNYRKN